MKNRLLAFAVILTSAVVISCESSDVTAAGSSLVTFKATMTPGAEVPPVTSATAAGTFTATLDTLTGKFVYDIVFSGLAANVTVGHIHGPASETATASPILNFGTLLGAQFTTGATSGTAHGEVTLNATTNITTTVTGDSLKKLLYAGLAYANIHTSTNPNGEIRGQITKQP